MDVEESLRKRNEREARIAHRKRRWSARLKAAQAPGAIQISQLSAPDTAASRLHKSARGHVAGIMAAFDGANAAVLENVQAGEAQRAAAAISTLEELQAQADAVEAARPAQQAVIQARAAALLQLGDPTELAAAAAELAGTVASSSDAAEALVRRSEGMQLRGHERYLATLKQQAGDRDALLGAMSEQLAELQAACGRQLEALDAQHTRAEQAALDADTAEIAGLCEQREAAELAFMEQQLQALNARQEELQELRVRRAEEYRSLRATVDTEVKGLERACSAQRAAHFVDAEQLRLAHEKLLLDGPDQQEAVEAHTCRAGHLRKLLTIAKRAYAEEEQGFLRENAALGEEHAAALLKLRDLQARDAAAHALASVKLQEVKRMKLEELGGIGAELRQAASSISQLLTGRAHEGDADTTDGGAAAGTAADVGTERSWQIIESVLSRTCVAWQAVEAEEQQQSRLQQELALLVAAAHAAQAVQT